ncbi:MAG: hypothetical protein HY883_02835, partial [Deltaproteobacteria bacterium]|nr:hypothetical protein [Deltaproteobacteria bacterium]
DLIDCKSWVGEDLKITLRRNIPNEPDRAYATLTDEENIIHNSAGVDLNQKSRLTRLILFWDKKTIGKIDEIKDFNSIDIALDSDAESVNEYGETLEKKIFCRWLRQGYEVEETMARFIANFLARGLFRQRNAQPLVSFDVEVKDMDIKTGSYARVSTDELENVDGAPLSNEIFQIVKR